MLEPIWHDAVDAAAVVAGAAGLVGEVSEALITMSEGRLPSDRNLFGFRGMPFSRTFI